jgi:glycosyltransferase involved in cell wall biosynthesis
MATIDIIVPCYRYGHFLRQCVESVVAQSFQDFRVLIIDDASPDATSDVAAQAARDDSRVLFVRHATNRGHIITYNEGIAWASADYLLLLSADDYLLPCALAHAVRFMDRHDEVGFVHGACLSCGSEPLPNPPPVEGPVEWQVMSGMEFLKAVCTSTLNPVATPTAIVRTALQKQLGGYRCELVHSGDLEMWMRFAARAAVARTGTPLAVRRVHGANMSRDFHSSIIQDYVQRKAAFDLFFENVADKLPRKGRLQRRANRALAEQMFWTGIGQGCRGNRDTSWQLLGLAVEICPDLRFWPPLHRLAAMPQVRQKIHDATDALGARVMARLRRSLS